MTIQRVGDALVIGKPGSATSSDGFALSTFRKKKSASLQQKHALFSKFLYKTLEAVDKGPCFISWLSLSSSSFWHIAFFHLSETLQVERQERNGSNYRSNSLSEQPKNADSFSRIVEWKFGDSSMLIGSNSIIFGCFSPFLILLMILLHLAEFLACS